MVFILISIACPSLNVHTSHLFLMTLTSASCLKFAVTFPARFVNMAVLPVRPRRKFDARLSGGAAIIYDVKTTTCCDEISL